MSKDKNNNLLTTSQATSQDMVNSSELTQQDIDYSIKIGKQTIKHSLEQTVLKNDTTRENLMKTLNKTMDVDKVQNILKKEFKTLINLDKKVTKLRAAWNAFNEDKIDTNFGLVISAKYNTLAYNIAAPNNYTVESYGKLVKDKKISLPYLMLISMVSLNNNNDNQHTARSIRHIASESTPSNWSDNAYTVQQEMDNGWHFELTLPETLLVKMRNTLSVLTELYRLENENKELLNKLNNIDSTMENMEAKLLAQELNRSDRGQDVLKVTAGIITEVIGKDVQLTLNDES